jgi:hypothetical protein
MKPDSGWQKVPGPFYRVIEMPPETSFVKKSSEIVAKCGLKELYGTLFY